MGRNGIEETPTVGRRTLLSLAGAAVGGLAGCSTLGLGDETDVPVGAAPTATESPSESESTTETRTTVGTPLPVGVVANERVTVQVIVDDFGPLLVDWGRREGTPHADWTGPSFRLASDDLLTSERVESVDDGARSVEVVHELESANTGATATLTAQTEVAPDLPAVTFELAFENTTESKLTLDAPTDEGGPGVALGEAHLTPPEQGEGMTPGWANPGRHRYSPNGRGPWTYADAGRYDSYDLGGDVPHVTTFDDDRAVSYGLDATASASDPLRAVVDGRPPSELRLFGTAVTVAPGDSATWRTALAMHGGGDRAPERGGELVREALAE